MNMRVAIAGATGLVGRTMLELLDERDFPLASLRLLASTRSAGTEIVFRGESIRVEELVADSFVDCDIALFSAGGSTSRRFAPTARDAGAVVIDNSSAWRMDPAVPLVVPEVNAATISADPGIIANPNCSTIQLVVPLDALSNRFGLERVVLSTYQAISGAGARAVEQLRDETEGRANGSSPFRHPVAYNTTFHDFLDGAIETEEEQKVERETRKILGLAALPITATCVRIPTIGAHGESVNVELSGEATRDDIIALLSDTPGVVVVDDPGADRYPTVLESQGKDEIFVGRIRPDRSRPRCWNLWIVSDNLRKGAATNAIQIAEKVVGLKSARVDV